MQSKLTELTPETACVCNSGKTWGKCCGALSDEKGGYVGYVSQVPNPKCVRFLVVDMNMGAVCNEKDEIFVFTERAQAVQFAQRHSKVAGQRFGAAGYTEERWAEFVAAGHKFTVVGTAYA